MQLFSRSMMQSKGGNWVRNGEIGFVFDINFKQYSFFFMCQVTFFLIFWQYACTIKIYVWEVFANVNKFRNCSQLILSLTLSQTKYRS